ncbi:MAG: hypothetical protein QXG65_05730 [Thermoplasmata archaeon]
MSGVGRVVLPVHPPEGESDHAEIDPVADRFYVAHRSTDSVEVFDLGKRGHLRTIPGLSGVVGSGSMPRDGSRSARTGGRTP